VVIDHFARSKAVAGPNQPGFDVLLALVKSGRAYVKISATYRISDKPPDYPDAPPIAQAIINANPDRVVWGSNWPHPGRGKTREDIAPPHESDDGAQINSCPDGPPIRRSARKSWSIIRPGSMASRRVSRITAISSAVQVPPVIPPCNRTAARCR